MTFTKRFLTHTRLMGALCLLALGMLGINTAYAAPSDDFVIEVDIPAGSLSFSILTSSSSAHNYQYTVDCGRDSTSSTTVTQTGSFTCAYSSEGTRSIRIKDASGNKTGFPVLGKDTWQTNCHGNNDKLKKIIQWGTGKWQSMWFAFAGCSALHSDEEIAAPDLSQVNTMRRMFYNASAFNQPIGNWDVSNVTDMRFMFSNARAFNQPIGNWNVSNVTDMYSMFFSAYAFNQPIGNWDVSNVTGMDRMFFGARAFNQPIGNWDVSSVTGMERMFNSATAFNQPIGNWDVGKVTDMSAMFSRALSTLHYDELLTGWAATGKTISNSIQFNAGNNQYCSNAAKNSKDRLSTTHSWTITSPSPERKCPLVWTGSSNNLWDNTASWSILDTSVTSSDTLIPANRIPSSSDEVVFDKTGSVVIIRDNAAEAKTLTMTKNFTGTIEVGNQLTIGSHYHQTGGTLKFATNSSTISLTIGSDASQIPTPGTAGADRITVPAGKAYIGAAARSSGSSSSGGGGGGSASTWLIALLGGLALLRRRSVRGYQAKR